MLSTSINFPGYDFTHTSHILQRKKISRIITPNHELKCNTIIYLLHPFATNRFFWSNYFNSTSNSHCIFALPESGRNWFINDEQGMRYEDYFIFELIPDIEKQFTSLKNRVIGGFSMGGAAAFFLAFRHPLLFDLSFSLAGAFLASERIGDPYHTGKDHENLMTPTEQEHNKVWGKIGSATRETYHLHNLYKNFNTEIKTRFIFEVGLQDHERIVQMNRLTKEFFCAHAIPHTYNEFSGNHSKKYAYDGLNRIIREHIISSCNLK